MAVNDPSEVTIAVVPDAPVEQPPAPTEPLDIAQATAFIQEHCRLEQWERELNEEESLYYRNVSVKMTVDTGEIVYQQQVLDQQIPLNLFYIRAARMLFAAQQRHEELKAAGV